MNNPSDLPRTIEVITGVARRRRWMAEQKRRLVLEAEEPGMSVSAVDPVAAEEARQDLSSEWQ